MEAFAWVEKKQFSCQLICACGQVANSRKPFRLLARHNLKLPELLEDSLYWMMVSTGMLSFLTVGALIVAIIGSFLPSVGVRAKIMMWIVVVLSMAAFVYLTQFFIP